jgi:hypothetical protein
LPRLAGFFVERGKALLGFRAKGREVVAAAEGYQLWESLRRYGRLFDFENDDIGPKNTFPLGVNTE